VSLSKGGGDMARERRGGLAGRRDTDVLCVVGPQLQRREGGPARLHAGWALRGVPGVGASYRALLGLVERDVRGPARRAPPGRDGHPSSDLALSPSPVPAPPFGLSFMFACASAFISCWPCFCWVSAPAVTPVAGCAVWATAGIALVAGWQCRRPVRRRPGASLEVFVALPGRGASPVLARGILRRTSGPARGLPWTALCACLCLAPLAAGSLGRRHPAAVSARAWAALAFSSTGPRW